jgi:hypothetical protein
MKDRGESLGEASDEVQVAFVPEESLEAFLEALFAAGAGRYQALATVRLRLSW